MKLLWNITHLNQKSHYTVLSVGCILGTFDINFIRHYTVYKKGINYALKRVTLNKVHPLNPIT